MTLIFSSAPVTTTAAYLGKWATEMSVSTLRSFSQFWRFPRNLFTWSLISTVLSKAPYKPPQLRLPKISPICYFTKKIVLHLSSFQRVSVTQELKPHFEKCRLSLSAFSHVWKEDLDFLLKLFKKSVCHPSETNLPYTFQLCRHSFQDVITLLLVLK